jgi:hypothetical protein
MGDLFYHEAAGPDAAPPVPVEDFEAFTAEELEQTLPRFNGSASSGLCAVPSQVVKHLAGDALVPLARFLTTCVAEGRPPASWRALKLVPLYKHKGDKADPDNYRGLAVGHPLAKLAMCAINQRLQTLADEGDLRATTQAGFRPGCTVEDLALVLQACI